MYCQHYHVARSMYMYSVSPSDKQIIAVGTLNTWSIMKRSHTVQLVYKTNKYMYVLITVT